MHTGRYYYAVDFDDYSYPSETWPVFAAEGGTVKAKVLASDFGWVIMIDHPVQGLTSFHAHLDPEHLYVSESESVAKGQLIARTGNSGSGGQGHHLHFEMRTDVDNGNVYSGWSKPIDGMPGLNFGAGTANGPQVTGRVLLRSRDPTNPNEGPHYNQYGYGETPRVWLEGNGNPWVVADEYGYFSIFDVSSDDYTIRGHYYFDPVGAFLCNYANGYSFTIDAYNNSLNINAYAATTMHDAYLINGNADGSCQVNIADFGILQATYLKMCGQEGFDERADFDESCQVNIADFGILSDNYLLSGPTPWAVLVSNGTPTRAGAGAGAAAAAPAERAVALSLAPSEVTVKSGEVFTVAVAVNNPKAQPIHGAEVHLDFDPRYLEVVAADGQPASAIAPGDTLPLVLYNAADNDLGRITFAAGAALGAASPTASFTLATLRFRAKASVASTSIVFSTATPRESEVVYGGGSVLVDLQGATVEIR